MLVGSGKPEQVVIHTIEGQRVVPSWMGKPQTTCTGRHRTEIFNILLSMTYGGKMSFKIYNPGVLM